MREGGAHGQSVGIRWAGHAGKGHRHRSMTPPPITAHHSPSHGASVGRSAGWGGGAETQLVRLLSHRHLNGLGLERGQVRSEGLEV